MSPLRSSLLVLASLAACIAHVRAMAASDAARMSRGRLAEALTSPSGKLTLTPELDVQDAKDPTALLLQASIVRTVSTQIRADAKANAAFWSGSITGLRNFCNEQEEARGNFPGPVPAVYCGIGELSDISDAGAEGVLLPVAGGKAIASPDDLASSDAEWVRRCQSILECGMQPILEVVLDADAVASLDMTQLIDDVVKTAEFEPVSILLSVGDSVPEGENVEVALPQVPKVPGVSILGSVRIPAKENRFQEETARYKQAGFNGAVLRAECVPGYGMNPNLEFIGNFWTACIGELKSTRSKTFNFRSKNHMEKNVATQWANYQQDVMDSGSLGAMEDAYTPDLDVSKGEYKGF